MSMQGCHTCVMCKVVGALVVIGALNWGLVGVADFNLVDHFFGVGSMVSRAIYSLVGLAGIMMLVSWFKACPGCSKSGCCKKDEHVER